VAIRRIDELKDLERCIELQKLIWGFEDIDIVPLPMFVVAAKVGGQVFGAFDGEQMVGFVMAVPGYRHGHPYLHSHMAALLPEYQGQGIGRQLKLRRADALDRGIKLVEWTFDPLEFRNAYFNFQRLGVIARRYVRNQYGVTSSPLHGGLPTDRLAVEWWLASSPLHGGLPTDRLAVEWWLDTPRVEAIIQARPAEPTGPQERIHVPNAIHEKKQSERSAALKMQAEVREQFESWFGQGYAVTGFEPDDAGGAYLLEPFKDEG
jgi:predicted GNAT superfamily acetyltransferase